MKMEHGMVIKMSWKEVIKKAMSDEEWDRLNDIQAEQKTGVYYPKIMACENYGCGAETDRNDMHWVRIRSYDGRQSAKYCKWCANNELRPDKKNERAIR